mmetsp:Transcript_5931/g.16634  ORF Transcript_5931/g.16634 Transcript_5931/m.16634 type:complete len:285 (+) Transcript_5931:2338-3192(+)
MMTNTEPNGRRTSKGRRWMRRKGLPSRRRSRMLRVCRGSFQSVTPGHGGTRVHHQRRRRHDAGWMRNQAKLTQGGHRIQSATRNRSARRCFGRWFTLFLLLRLLLLLLSLQQTSQRQFRPQSMHGHDIKTHNHGHGRSQLGILQQQSCQRRRGGFVAGLDFNHQLTKGRGGNVGRRRNGQRRTQDVNQERRTDAAVQGQGNEFAERQVGHATFRIGESGIEGEAQKGFVVRQDQVFVLGQGNVAFAQLNAGRPGEFVGRETIFERTLVVAVFNVMKSAVSDQVG